VPNVRISNVISQMAAVTGGAGLGVLPCFMARTDSSLVRLLADEVALTRSYWIITHAETRDVARAKLIADFIRSEAGQLPGFWDA
jgi:DNA-binding transcriptional LysR family regulator